MNVYMQQETDYIYEILIVNDGSTDGTAKILKSYQKEEKITGISQKNSGLSAAWNTGLDHASGR